MELERGSVTGVDLVITVAPLRMAPLMGVSWTSARVIDTVAMGFVGR